MTAEQEPAGPIVRDRRRIDPETGQVREPRTDAARSATDAQSGGGQFEGQPDLAAELAERTADLQRLQAEYLNYKRRVDRDRETARQNAIGSVLSGLLPVLDDINRAREHGELTGGFKAVAESLEGAVNGFGLESFGVAGEPFDPRIHDALMHSYSDEVSEPVCSAVLQVGYRHGERILRPARVAVAEPPTPAESSEQSGDLAAVVSDNPEEEFPQRAAGSDGAAQSSQAADEAPSAAPAESAVES